MAAHLLEIACFSYEAAWIAADAGADAIELCGDALPGGGTPGNETFVAAIPCVMVPINCMVRTRADDRCSQADIEQMNESIRFFLARGVEGIVTGALTENGSVDIDACKQLVAAAGPMKRTFHRAFDRSSDRDAAIREIINLGFSRVLTSGGTGSAIEGLREIARLQSEYGKDIAIVPAGNVRSSNLAPLIGTGCTEFHSSAIVYGDLPDVLEIKNMKVLISHA
jgi:copper homeostasis protein